MFHQKKESNVGGKAKELFQSLKVNSHGGKWKNKIDKKKQGQRQGQRQGQGRGVFFFSPKVSPHWIERCRYRKPNFLFLRSWMFCWGNRIELHVLSYINFPLLKLENRKERWQSLISRLPTRYSRKILKKYVENYERMMRSRRFPKWQKKQEKRALKKSYLKTTPLKKEWFLSFILRKIRFAWFFALEKNVVRHFFEKKENVTFVYHYLRSPWISSTLCVRYFAYRLKQKRIYFKGMIRRFLMHTNFYGGEKHNLYGIYISGAGRFTRRQRASFVKLQRGRVPFSTVRVPMDYTFSSLPLKYGACSIRVWVCHLRSQG